MSDDPAGAGGPLPTLDRRSLLARAAAAAGAATVATFWFEGLGDPGRRARIEPTRPGDAAKALDAAEWAALGAAVDRLLPSGGPEDPGARDVNAIGYLDAVLASPEIEDEVKAVVREGARKLDEAARVRGAAGFAALAEDARDEVLRAFESAEEGRVWLRRTVTFTLEAFLGDPVHGGNVGMAGWRWANHKPGTPRPKRKG